MCPFIYNILPETLSVKLLFRTLWIVSNFNTSIAAISNLRKVSLCIGEDIPRCMKVILNSNLWWDSNFLYFIPQIASIQRFLFFASSFLMAFVIPLENNDIFKLSILWISDILKSQGIFVKDSKFTHPVTFNDNLC